MRCEARRGAGHKDTDGRAKLYADIAHPINSDCRELIQRKVIEAYEEELVRSKEPGYLCTLRRLRRRSLRHAARAVRRSRVRSSAARADARRLASHRAGRRAARPAAPKRAGVRSRQRDGPARRPPGVRGGQLRRRDRLVGAPAQSRGPRERKTADRLLRVPVGRFFCRLVDPPRSSGGGPIIRSLLSDADSRGRRKPAGDLWPCARSFRSPRRRPA